jgi:hypothetical protein
MTAEEFLRSYVTAKQHHEHAWEDIWQRDLRPFFGPYFLEQRSEVDRNWGTMPQISKSIIENDDTTSFITGGHGHFIKRYYVTQKNGGFVIDRIMIRCSVCEGTGNYDDEPCELCGGRGWDDWLD